jgi:hypothetical protein
MLLSVLVAEAQQSVLRSGTWFKLSVEKNGIYKINYDLIKKMGLDPGKLDPRNLRIHGNKGGMLPQSNNADRPIDLVENAIFVNGESDGKFDKQDFILFYAEGPDKIEYDVKRDIFSYEHNLYSDKNFYFLTVGDDAGKRIGTSDDLGQGFPTIREFNDYIFHEKDDYNDLHSGREWYGEKFGISTAETNFPFSLEGIASGSSIKIVSDVLGQSYSNASFLVSLNGVSVAEQKLLTIPNSRYGTKGVHKRDTILVNSTNAGADSKSTLEVKYQFVKGSGFSQGYLDFFLISCLRKLALYNDQTIIVSKESLGNPATQFEISSASDQITVWDITDPANTKNQNFSFTNGTAAFSTTTTNLKKFIVFNDNVPAPSFAEEVSNQNLHGLSTPNLIIVTHPDFLDEALRLAAHREGFSKLSVEVVTTEEVYNEFSSGRQDVSAIRDFVKFIYDKNPSALKALLLFGKGSYDYKDRLVNNKNFVATYESRNSLSPLQTYSSDDYFGFMENNEGIWPEEPAKNHTMDIGVGRLPVATVQESKNIVDKLIDYDTNKKAFGYWRKKIVFVADDGNSEDGYTSLHQYQADQLAQYVEGLNSGIDTKKLFMGSYVKTVKPNGETIPKLSDDIERSFDRGSLIINYTGHGSEIQWADEKVFSNLNLEKLNNKLYPFMVTATCEFGRHDDPQQTSSAVLSVTLEKAGAIGLVTTTRPVNATTNFNLNLAFYEALFQQENNSYLSIGEVFRRTKNNSVSGVSNRNFSLLGDPSMTLALPPNTVQITSLKTAEGSDTLKALSSVEAKGEVRNSFGQKLSDFNGIVEVTLFDKEATASTIGKNDPAFTYTQWSNALFRGKASVTNGEFKMTFVIPKNIAYQVDKGKFSLYASDPVALMDASGSNTNARIGESEVNVIPDNTAPQIRLFMGDTTFVNGGITSPNTYLIANLTDNVGINISNYGIGNSLIAVLDNGMDTYNLNEYYVADTNNFSSGWVNYPIKNLTPGKHSLTLKAWDVFNNPSEATIDFIVSDGENLVIESFGNYPNPFRENTSLFFTHNRSGDDLQAQVFIQNISGEVIKTIEFTIPESDYMVNLMELDIPEFDKKLSAGLYLARLVVRSLTNGSRNERVTKLIVLLN